MTSKVALTLTFFAFTGLTRAIRPSAPVVPVLQLFTAGQSLGDILEDTPVISDPSPVDRICQRGVWMSYTGRHYTFGGVDVPYQQIMLYPALYDKPICFGETEVTFQSVRTAGITSDNSIPSVTLFSGDKFQYFKIVGDAGIPEINFEMNSFITILATHMEVFDNYNYKGNSYCVDILDYASCQFLPSLVCWRWHLDRDNGFPWDIKQAKSVKLGCNPVSKLYKAEKDSDHIAPKLVMTAKLNQ